MKNGFGGRIEFEFLLSRVFCGVSSVTVELSPLVRSYDVCFRKQSVHGETKSGRVGRLSEEKFTS